MTAALAATAASSRWLAGSRSTAESAAAVSPAVRGGSRAAPPAAAVRQQQRRPSALSSSSSSSSSFIAKQQPSIAQWQLSIAQQQRRGALRVVAAAAADAPADAAAGSGAFMPEKPTLFGVPVSNCAARNRWVIYKKGLEDEIDVQAPKLLGEKGVRSPAYLALNPQGKMPMMVLPDGTSLPESQVIEQYLLDKYASVGPSLIPPTPELRAKAHLASRIHDLYVQPLQGCMYKKMDAAQRCDQLQSIDYQLDVLEGLLDPAAGPFVAGAEISFGDAALFPTFVFFTEILPKHFGWSTVFGGRPKLEAWWAAVQKDPEAARVIAEMRGGVADWEAAKLWDVRGVAAQVADGSFNWSCQ